MKKDQLIEHIKSVGLSDNEANVYFAALTLGPSTVLKISKLAELKRSTTYSVIEALEKKGLMHTRVQGFKTLYAASDPNSLEKILETRRNKFHEALPELSGLYNLGGEESYIKHYKGWESAKEIFELLISDLKRGDPYTVYSNAGKWNELDPEFLQKFRDKRAKIGLDLRLILENDSTAREFKKFEKNLGGKIKLLPSHIKLDMDTITTPHRVAFLQIVEPVQAIVIENKTIIDAHQKSFDIMWDALPD